MFIDIFEKSEQRIYWPELMIVENTSFKLFFHFLLLVVGIDEEWMNFKHR